jgi:hypothetical protein
MRGKNDGNRKVKRREKKRRKEERKLENEWYMRAYFNILTETSFS